jgi:hypothetical protein
MERGRESDGHTVGTGGAVVGALIHYFIIVFRLSFS